MDVQGRKYLGQCCLVNPLLSSATWAGLRPDQEERSAPFRFLCSAPQLLPQGERQWNWPVCSPVYLVTISWEDHKNKPKSVLCTTHIRHCASCSFIIIISWCILNSLYRKKNWGSEMFKVLFHSCTIVSKKTNPGHDSVNISASRKVPAGSCLPPGTPAPNAVLCLI